MCLAIPVKLKKIDGLTAIGEAGGMTREIRVDFIDAPAPGDYVMVHAGFAIQKITEAQALENIALMEEIEDAL